MGSFNYICGLSGMPIVPGEEVRVMLLTQNPYYGKGAAPTCETNGRWFPRTLPLKAVYDDYGGVRHRDDRKKDWTGLDGDLWRKGFDLDLVVKGVGSNEYHDCAVSHGQDIHHYIGAAQEGRLYVRRDVDLTGHGTYNESVAKSRAEHQPPPGIPTMDNVRAAITAMDLPKGVDFYIDTEVWGEVRVRVQDRYNVKEYVDILYKIRDTMPEYSGMVSAGKYAEGELILRPKPGTKDFHGLHAPMSEEPLPVGYAMFREDVWQATVGMINGVEHYNKEYKRVTYAPDYYVEAFEKAFKIHRGLLKKYKDDGFMARISMESAIRHNPAEWVLKDPVISCVGPAVSWQIFVENADSYSEAEQKAIIQDFAEYGCVQSVNAHMHNDWRLSRSASQTVEIKDWAKYFEAMSKVAETAAAEWKKRYGEDDE